VGANEKKMTTMKGCIKCHGPTDHGGHCERCDPSQLESLSPSRAAPCSAGPAAFPVNPERDEKGNAVLYPGMVRYEGVAAIFGTAATDQFVILAPTVEGLKRALSDHNITNSLNVGACRIATLESLPNA
jgi:hypothetical protein